MVGIERRRFFQALRPIESFAPCVDAIAVSTSDNVTGNPCAGYPTAITAIKVSVALVTVQPIAPCLTRQAETKLKKLRLRGHGVKIC